MLLLLRPPLRRTRKLEVAEMRMLRWMCGHTRLDKIRNEVFRVRLGVAGISDKIREGRLRWFGHVRRRQMTEPIRIVETLTVDGRRSRGRPKMTWDERIRQDLLDLHLFEDMVEDRTAWRRRIKLGAYICLSRSLCLGFGLLESGVSLEAVSLFPGIKVRLAYILPSPDPINSFAIGGIILGMVVVVVVVVEPYYLKLEVFM
ncbi:hypothetical protein Hanom_Chr03g00231861 [Helianthus anomalus]